MHAKLYRHNCPLPFPHWFPQGIGCTLYSETQLKKLSTCMKAAADELPMELPNKISTNRLIKTF